MRRRKRTLQPDNFPFLAVLLCTMGSLILVLLVLDHRARAVARSKAQQVWTKVEQEEAQELARIEAEREQALADHLARHQAEQQQLRDEQQQLEAQRTNVLSELETVRRAIEAEEERQRTEKGRQASEASRAHGEGQALIARQEQIARSQRELDKARAEREKLTAYLLRLEQQLALLKKQKEQSRDTWSVVPYAGKRGCKGRPLYVECSARGLTFHPDRFVLAGFDVTPESILEEVRRRSEAHVRNAPADNPDAREAYWMLLVRPDGIERYYQVLGAIQGMDLPSGYEFVDADWNLDFPDTSSVAIVPRPAMPTAPGNGNRGGNATGGGSPGGGTHSGPVAVTPIPIATLPRGGADGTGPGGNGGATLLVPRTQGPGHGGEGSPSSASQPRNGEGTGQRGSVAGQAPSHPSPQPPPRNGEGEQRPSPPPRFGEGVGGRGSPSDPGTREQPTPPVAGSQEHKTNGTAEGSSGGGSPASQGTAEGTPRRKGVVEPPGVPGDGKKDAQPKPLRPASRFGDPELVIEIECSAKGVKVSPGHLDIPLQELSRGRPGAQQLLNAVRETIARREAAMRPGEPAVRPSIRFVVQHDALRTFHLVYPVLDVLPIPKHTVLPEE